MYMQFKLELEMMGLNTYNNKELVDKLYKLNHELNNLLNDRLKELGVDGEFGVTPPNTSEEN